MSTNETPALIFSNPSQSHNHKKHHPSKPPVPPKGQPPFTLMQNACAFIDTAGIEPNGKAIIDFPGCTTVTIYQAFNSPEARAVWDPILNANPFFANAPQNPAKSSLLVFTNVAGQVEVMEPFNMGTQFSLSNSILPEGGSQYYLSTPEPGVPFPLLFMNLKSPDTTVVIPGNLYGGPGKDCINMGYQPPPASATHELDFISKVNRNKIR